jgi:hypothetical protein
MMSRDTVTFLEAEERVLTGVSGSEESDEFVEWYKHMLCHLNTMDLFITES